MPAFSKLTVSNIAWDAATAPDAMRVLGSCGVNAIEVAPTVIWPEWKGATVDAAQKLRDEFNEKGFQIPSLQAILFATSDLHLFGSDEQRRALKIHLEKVADLAQALGAKILVFGAPKNRLRGELIPEQAFSIAANFFKEVGDAFEKKEVCLCIEPNPVQYGCDFITNSSEGLELVSRVNSPGFGLHLDVAGMHLAGESIQEAINNAGRKLRHLHVSEPDLQDFTSPICNHAQAARALRDINYDGWVSIEMRKSGQPLKSVRRACEYVMEQYFDAQPSRN